MKNLYCIVDTVNKEWGPVVIMNNDESAERMFRQEVDKIPSDILPSLELYRIGMFKPEFIVESDVLSPIYSESFGVLICTGKDILSEDLKEIVDES